MRRRPASRVLSFGHIGPETSADALQGCRAPRASPNKHNEGCPVYAHEPTSRVRGRSWLLVALAALLSPALARAQSSPFDTGANSLVDFALTIATPIAVLIVIALAIAAAVGRISWGWVIGALVGIAAIFGAPQIVEWIRALFGV